MGNSINNNPAYNAIRQMAKELLVSQNVFDKGSYSRNKEKDRLFGMRFVDKERRFKWSTTDLTYSEETIEIVKQYQREDRTAYIQQYADGTKIEFIG